MLRVGIVGAKGFGGEELLNVLVNHAEVRLTYLADKLEAPEPIGATLPQFAERKDLVCEPYDDRAAAERCDLVFLALPHRVSMQVAPALAAKGKKIIDLSADYRLRNTAVYAAYYKTPHKDKANLKRAVYGLPELYRVKIRKVLGIVPALTSGIVDPQDIIVDAKSGVTGAGRKAAEAFPFDQPHPDFKGYRFLKHQHAPEIDQEVSRVAVKKIRVAFCPHLLPARRGILETIYFKTKKAVSLEKAHGVYKRFYKTEPFVRVCEAGALPQLKDVVMTNFCDVGVAVDPEQRRLVVVAAIDNLLKGASGQAVQNMNLMCGFPEATALSSYRGTS